MTAFIWFDLDDTVWDFRTNSRISQRQLHTRFGLGEICPDPEKWIETYERHNHALWSRYNIGEISRDTLMRERFIRPLTELGMSPDEAGKLHSVMSEFYLDYLGTCTATVPGAVEAVKAVRRQGHRTGIISNGFREVQYRKMDSAGITGLFDVVVLSDEIGINKPDLRLFRYAQEKAGVTPGQCVIIGDNPDTDIAGAVNAGWTAIYFNPDRNPVPSGALEISVMKEVPGILADL